MNAYQEVNIFDNINNMAIRLRMGLDKINNLQNIRNCGLLFAFYFEDKSKRDIFEDKSKRDIFVKELIDNKMLCNPTREKNLRLRPNLCVTAEEVDHAVSIMQMAADKI